MEVIEVPSTLDDRLLTAIAKQFKIIPRLEESREGRTTRFVVMVMMMREEVVCDGLLN
jgi:hypothetical protein